MAGAKRRRDHRQDVGQLRVESLAAALSRELQRCERRHEAGKHQEYREERACADDRPCRRGQEGACERQVGEMTEPQPEARALHLSAKSTRARQLVERLFGPGDETVEPLPGRRLARRLFTHYQVRLQQLRDRRAPEPPDQDDAGGAKQRSRERDQRRGAARTVGEP